MANKLLIIEDDPDFCERLEKEYREKSWRVCHAQNIEGARRILIDEDFNPQVVIADLGLPEGNILEHIEELNTHCDHSEWVFLLDAGAEAHTDGLDEFAYDVLESPCDLRRLQVVAQRAARAAMLARRLKKYSSEEAARHNIDAYVGSSAAVQELKELFRRLAEVPISTMIISGETGTGKGLAARIIHNNGLRKHGPLVELNCAALPRELLESQLFGHEAGAFTGARARHRGLLEQADGGTLFLDEIGDMDLELQAKLLKAIEDKYLRRLGGEKAIEIDVQIIAASNTDLTQAVAQDRFRADLYHRLNVFNITLPPLRERKEDLVELVPRIIGEFNHQANRRVEYVPDAVWEMLLAYDWPGNVRELRNVLERSVLLSKNEELPAQWLQLQEDGFADTSTHADQIEKSSQDVESVERTAKKDDASEVVDAFQETERGVMLPLDGSMALDEMDSIIIQKALALHDYNITETARSLKTTRETLRYRIQKYNLKTTA